MSVMAILHQLCKVVHSPHLYSASKPSRLPLPERCSSEWLGSELVAIQLVLVIFIRGLCGGCFDRLGVFDLQQFF